MIGGLVSATLLTLFVLPVLYAIAEGRAARRETAPKHVQASGASSSG